MTGRQLFGVLRWFQLFCLFHLVLACLSREAIFRFPPAFVVWSFFICHRHLWSVLSFSLSVSFFYGLFCRRHSY